MTPAPGSSPTPGSEPDEDAGASTTGDESSTSRGLRALIKASPGSSWLRFAWFHLLRAWCWVWFKLFYRFRVTGAEHVPRTGPVLIVANHQSFLDPIIVGLATGARPLYSLARSSLYRGPVAWLIRSLNGIAVKRGEADTQAMRRCIDVLQGGYMLVVYPEGTRSRDEAIGEFKGGLMLLLRRAKPTVVPLAIAGSYNAWPRERTLPRLFGRIRAGFGEPIDAAELLAVQPDEALKRLRDEVVRLKEQA